MQAEIHSYSFPLFPRAENALIAAYRQRQLLIGAVTAANASTLSLFSYEDENIKKASGRTRKCQGRVKELAVNQHNAERFSAFITQNEDKFHLHRLNHNAFSNDQETLSEILLIENEPIDNLAIRRDNSSIYLSSPKQIQIYDLEKQTVSGRIAHNLPNPSNLAIDPTFEMPTLSNAREILFFDKKTNNQKYSIKSEAAASIINLDFNPNKQYNLMTCHHESIKFWDLRKGSIPFKTHEDHHNLLTNARYNHSHDELIACAYDDGSVGLLRLVSASSSIQDEAEDALVRLYDEHEDSVMRVEWMRCSPWMFASIAYNAAQLVINVVPSAEKYRILL